MKIKYLNYLINQREIITPISPKASQITDTITPTVDEKKTQTKHQKSNLSRERLKLAINSQGYALFKQDPHN